MTQIARIGSALWVPDFDFVPTNQSLGITAAGNKYAYIGQVSMAGHPSGAKTISSSGGKLHFSVSTLTWANGSTNVRVGIQDLDGTSLPGAPDGTFDVYADMVPGVDALSVGTLKSLAMTSGTKSISDGDFVAVVWEMTALGGSDKLNVSHIEGSSILPFGRQYTTSWQNPNYISLPPLAIEFDDGTLAKIEGGYPVLNNLTGSNEPFATGTNPNERGMAFSVPNACKARLVRAHLSIAAATSSGVIKLYSDPYGTPTLLTSLTIEGWKYGKAASAGVVMALLPADVLLVPNAIYGLTILATGAGNITLYPFSLASSSFNPLLSINTDVVKITRNGSSGAFTAASGVAYSRLALGVTKIDDGSPAPTLALGI